MREFLIFKIRIFYYFGGRRRRRGEFGGGGEKSAAVVKNPVCGSFLQDFLQICRSNAYFTTYDYIANQQNPI